MDRIRVGDGVRGGEVGREDGGGDDDDDIGVDC